MLQNDKLFDLSVEPMCIAGTDGYFKRVNKAFEEVLGFSEEELTSRPFLDFVHPDDIDSTLQVMEELEEGKTTLDFTNRYRTQNGEYRWFSWSARTDHTKERIFATARDLTDRIKMEEDLKRAKQQMEKANSDLEAFSYSVSHDLRTPLRAISGFSEILLEDYSEELDDEGKRLLNVVIDNSQKMGRLIDDILSFSRVAQTELVKTRVNMSTIFSEACKTVIDEYSELQDKLDITVQNLPEAHGDLPLLKQAAINLVSNAVKYSSKNDAIEITVGYTQDDDMPTYYVRDNGVGFDMKYANKLFGVFQRLHSSTEYEGTGVGLSLVKHIIDRHGGDIWAQSEPGKGAAFFFKLSNSNTKINGYDHG